MVSMMASDSLRVCAGSLPAPKISGTSRRTTIPCRRSITKNGTPMTLRSSQ
jgi:hypothetical protein